MKFNFSQLACFPLSLLLSSSLTSAFASDVHIVASDGSGDFTSLSVATTQAADGDVLLVRPGNYGYSDVVIQGKGLTIVRDGAGQVEAYANIQILNIPGNREVHISGLRYRDLEIDSCQGQVLVEDWAPYYRSAASVTSCDSVTIVNSEFIGVGGYAITGGQANYGADGGPGLKVSGSTVTLYSTTSTGGAGDDGAWVPCGVGGDGGPGLLVLDNASHVRHIDSNFIGGPRGYGGCSDGWEGSSTSAPAGTLIELTMPFNAVTGDAVIREGNTYTLTIVGTPGIAPMMLTTTNMDQRLLPPSIGVLHMRPPFTIEFLPPIPASGVLEYPISIPMLPSAAEGRWRLMQVVINDPGGRYLAAPRSLLVVDQGL